MGSPDLVASLHSDPLGNGPVLFLLLGEEALNPERLVGRLANERNTTLSVKVSPRFLFAYSPKCTSTKLELVANIYTERHRLTCVAAQSRYRLASLSFILLQPHHFGTAYRFLRHQRCFNIPPDGLQQVYLPHRYGCLKILYLPFCPQSFPDYGGGRRGRRK